MPLPRWIIAAYVIAPCTFVVAIASIYLLPLSVHLLGGLLAPLSGGWFGSAIRTHRALRRVQALYCSSSSR